MTAGRLLVVMLALGAPGAAVWAEDIYTRQQENGAQVLTNVPPRSGKLLRRGEVGRRPAARPAPRTRPFDHVVRQVAAHYTVEPSLVHAVIEVESGYDPSAVSPRGAVGLMQLMPETAAALGVQNPGDPYANIVAGVRHLRRLLDRYEGNLELTLAAYNAGPAAVERYGGIPPYRETHDYIRRIRQRYAGPGLVVSDGERDPIFRYVDGRGTLVITQFPGARRGDARRAARAR